MRKSRYISSILLILIAFIFIGEYFVWHLNNFQDSYIDTTFYPTKEHGRIEMLRDVYNKATKYNVDLFVVNTKIKSLIDVDDYIYCTQGAKNRLTKDSISTGTFTSVVLGKINVKILDFRNIPEDFTPEKFYLIGNYEDMKKLKVSLVDTYGGRFPHELERNISDKMVIVGIWIGILSLMLIMTLYEVSILKKEMVIRLISGQSTGKYILQNIISDSLFYLLLFILSATILSKFAKITYLFGMSVIIYLSFIMLNSLIFLTLYNFNFKKDINTLTSVKKVISLSYGYKIITVSLVLVLLSGTIFVLNDAIDFGKQKYMFERYKNSSYVSIPNKKNLFGEYSIKLFNKMYNKKESFTFIALGDPDDEGYEYIYTDKTGKSLIENESYNRKRLDLNERKVYLFVPLKYRFNKNFFIKNISYYLNGIDRDEIKVLYYNHGLYPAVNPFGEITSVNLKNPIIIYNNMEFKSYKNYYNAYSIVEGSMLKISDKELKSFVKEYKLDDDIYYKTNVYDNYMNQLKTKQRTGLIGTVLLGILLLLNFVVDKNLISNDYTVNAVEKNLKKILGYSFIRINYKNFLSTIVPSLLGIGIGIIIINYFKLDIRNYIIISGCLLCIIDLLVMIYYEIKFGRISTNKIFKGGLI
ncbi:MAG: hypothetical protein LBM02_06080 [Lachnospiraceae bacterium]|nr:hypothetical protein [Lachnospiraceae bacterium]